MAQRHGTDTSILAIQALDNPGPGQYRASATRGQRTGPDSAPQLRAISMDNSGSLLQLDNDLGHAIVTEQAPVSSSANKLQLPRRQHSYRV